MFLSHYIESFDAIEEGYLSLQPGLWFDRLPEFLASPIQSPVKYSIRAVGMCFYGVLTGNIPIRTNAYSWYAGSLRSLHSLLQNRATMGDGNMAVPTEDIICASIMMSQFEIMASTTPTAWMQHVEAAAAMLVNRGPENCSLGLAHQMFLTVRLFIVSNLYFDILVHLYAYGPILRQAYVAMTTNKTHVFASQPWLTIPFEKRLKSPIDELVDIILSLPSCLVLGEEISAQVSRNFSVAEERLRKYARDIISRLDYWQQQFCTEVIAPEGRRQTSLHHTAEETLSTPGLIFDDPGSRTYRDVYTAIFSAVYDTANLIAFSYLLLTSAPTDQHKHRIQFHAQSILLADAFIKSNASPAAIRASSVMEFPLEIVSILGPQRLVPQTPRTREEHHQALLFFPPQHATPFIFMQ